jgi:hypothetical protein
VLGFAELKIVYDQGKVDYCNHFENSIAILINLFPANIAVAE